MTEQELITTPNDTEAERVRWMTVALTAGNEITALKAQVNCLRGYLKEISEYWNGDTNEIVMKDACYQALNVSQEALERIPEQCLAEVKAKVWDEGYDAGVLDKNPYKTLEQAK